MWRGVRFIFRGRDADPGAVSRRRIIGDSQRCLLSLSEANFAFGRFDGAEPDRGGDRSEGGDETGNQSEASHQQRSGPTRFGIRQNLSAISDVCCSPAVVPAVSDMLSVANLWFLGFFARAWL